MSFLDRVGDVFQKAGGGIGWAFSAASDVPIAPGKNLGDFGHAATDPIVQGADGLAWLYSNTVARPVSTTAQMLNQQQGSFFDTSFLSGKDWSQAWSRSENVSPGQAIIGSAIDTAPVDIGQVRGPDPFSDANAAQRQKFFTDTWQGKLSSGAMDAAIGWYADPTVLVSKGGKAVATARKTVKPGEVEGVLSAAAEGVQKTRNPISQQAKANTVARLFEKTDGLTAGQMAAMPEFKASADAGALAYMFDSANRLFPEQDLQKADRHALKSQIFGAVLGNKESIDELKGSGLQLANEIERLGSVPTITNANAEFQLGDYGAALISKVNADPELEVADKIKKLSEEHKRLKDVISLQGSSDKILGSVPERLGAASASTKMTESWQAQGMAGRPLRFVVGTAQTRVPGFVHVKDPSRGYDDLLNTVGQMKHTAPELRQGLMDDWVQAGSDQERRNVVKKAEQVMFDGLAAKHNLSPEAARAMYDLSTGRREAVLSGLKNRVYSAADPDELVRYIDPEDDVEHVFDKAFLTTHVEQTQHLADPRQIDKMLTRGTNRRMLERWAGSKATPLSELGSESRDQLDQWATMFSKVWKDAALMRLAYPARIQVDTQARTMVHLGMLQWMATRKEVFGSQVKYLLENKDGEKSVRNFFKQGDMEGALGKQLLGDETYKNVPISPALDAEDVQRISAGIGSHGGAAADLGNDIASAELRKIRGTGNFETIRPTDVGWAENYVRAVDQIRTSPTARKALELSDIDDLAGWVKKDPAALKEWNEFSKGEDSLEGWLAKIVDANNHLLPTPELRAGVGSPKRLIDHFDIDAGLQTDVRRQARVDDAVAGHETAKQGVRDTKASIKKQQSDAREAVRSVRREISITQAARDSAPARSAARRAANAKLRTLQADRKSALAARDKLLADQKGWLKGSGSPDEVKAARQRSKENFREIKDLRTQLAGTLPDPSQKTILEARLESLKAERKALQEETRQAREGATQALADNPVAQAKEARRQAGQAIDTARTAKDGGTVLPSGKVIPMDVHGEVYSPLYTKGLGARMKSIREGWYSFAADAPETIMGRSPIYKQAFQDYMKSAIDRVGADHLSSEDIDRIRATADRKARQEIGNVLFDSSNTSNLAHAMRFVAPFFSAWEDTMRRWSGLLYDNPQMVPRGAQLWTAPNAAGLVQDSEGNMIDDQGKAHDPITGKVVESTGQGEYIVLPKAMGLGIPGGGQFKINKKSANILFQGDPPWLPGMGPLVQVPTNEVVRRAFPKEADNPILKYVMPFGVTDDSVPYQLLPSWMKQVRDSGVFGKTKDYNQTYAMLWASETAKFNAGNRKKKPTSDEVSNMTRNWFLLRAGIGNAAPVSMQPTPATQLYIDKAHQYRAQYGAKWMEKFYDDFPDYFELAMNLSVNETGINATEKAYDATQKYRSAIRENPDLGWMFVGPDNEGGAFNANINTWQRATSAGAGKNFRSTKDPQQAIQDIEASKGWLQYDQMARATQLKLEERGLHSFQQKGAEDLAAMRQGYIGFLSENNDSWRIAYEQRDQSKLETMVKAARTEWGKSSDFKNRSDQVALQNYLAGRDQVRQMLAQAGPSAGRSMSIDNPDASQVKQIWDAYTTFLRQGSPTFETMFNRLLEADDLTKDL